MDCVSYHDGPHHGQPIKASPGKRSKQCLLKIEGGPRAGDLVQYGQPLPDRLVLSSSKGWVDYVRKPSTTTYVVADDIPEV